MGECVWMRRADAREVFGIGRTLLDEAVRDGRVRARKVGSGAGGTVVFRASDIEEMIEGAPAWTPGAAGAADD